MIKTKMIRESTNAVKYEDLLDAKINAFIKDSKAKVIDIKFASTGYYNTPIALIIYEENEDTGDRI